MVALLLSFFLTLFLPEVEAGIRPWSRKGKSRKFLLKSKKITNGFTRKGGRHRKGRQEEVEEADDETPETRADNVGEDIHNGCDPNTNIGAFLNFIKFRKFCGGKGLTDFGPYGGLPADEGEVDDEGVVVEVA